MLRIVALNALNVCEIAPNLNAYAVISHGFFVEIPTNPIRVRSAHILIGA